MIVNMELEMRYELISQSVDWFKMGTKKHSSLRVEIQMNFSEIDHSFEGLAECFA